MTIELLAVAGIPEIEPGDDLAAAICDRYEPAGGDIVVVAQKIVSKAEDRFVSLADVTPTPSAEELAAETAKDPRLVQLILDESNAVLRSREGVLIVETHHGFVCANAGIDASNVPGDEDRVLLLPRDPDKSARELRAGIRERTGASVAVIVSDSFGRAWRTGQLDVAIGCAGIDPVIDLRGEADRDGRELAASIQAVADEIAAAADTARGKSSGEPVVVLRGRSELISLADGPGAVGLLRDRAEDLFR
jgi:coenzyme F420-0:L-glutamate ligase/coenzyme F420-1:gamma-L-glutamate ligase